MKCSNFAFVRGQLVTERQTKEWHCMIQQDFPLSHFILAQIVSTQYFKLAPGSQPLKLEEEETEPEKLHYKEKMILFIFLGLIWTKSRMLLRNWALVEPLEYFF